MDFLCPHAISSFNHHSVEFSYSCIFVFFGGGGGVMVKGRKGGVFTGGGWRDFQKEDEVMLEDGGFGGRRS